MSSKINTILGMIIVAAVLFGVIIFFAIIDFDLTPVEDINLEKVVVVEGYENSFCNSLQGKSAELNEQCQNLTRNNCLKTDCCVYAKMEGEEKCLAGNQNGPTFRFSGPNKTKNIDYYYYKDKCYGNKCPDSKS